MLGRMGCVNNIGGIGGYRGALGADDRKDSLMKRFAVLSLLLTLALALSACQARQRSHRHPPERKPRPTEAPAENRRKKAEYRKITAEEARMDSGDRCW